MLLCCCVPDWCHPVEKCSTVSSTRHSSSQHLTTTSLIGQRMLSVLPRSAVSCDQIASRPRDHLGTVLQTQGKHFMQLWSTFNLLTQLSDKDIAKSIARNAAPNWSGHLHFSSCNHATWCLAQHRVLAGHVSRVCTRGLL